MYRLSFGPPSFEARALWCRCKDCRVIARAPQDDGGTLLREARSIQRGRLTHGFDPPALILLGLCAALQPRRPPPGAVSIRQAITHLDQLAAGGPTDIEGRCSPSISPSTSRGSPNILCRYGWRGGVVGASYLGEVAPKTHRHGLSQRTSWIYVSEPGTVSRRLQSYEFIAYQSGTTVHFVRTDVPPVSRQPADIVKARGLIAGGLSLDTSKDLRLRMGLDMLGVATLKYVTGYRSSPPARLALQRGEINMFLGIAAQLPRRGRAAARQKWRCDSDLVGTM